MFLFGALAAFRFSNLTWERKSRRLAWEVKASDACCSISAETVAKPVTAAFSTRSFELGALAAVFSDGWEVAVLSVTVKIGFFCDLGFLGRGSLRRVYVGIVIFFQIIIKALSII